MQQESDLKATNSFLVCVCDCVCAARLQNVEGPKFQHEGQLLLKEMDKQPPPYLVIRNGPCSSSMDHLLVAVKQKAGNPCFRFTVSKIKREESYVSNEMLPLDYMGKHFLLFRSSTSSMRLSASGHKRMSSSMSTRSSEHNFDH